MNIDFAREKMIEQQVRASAVLDATVLEVLGKIPREEFVPPRYRALAFADIGIPLGHNESMMTPAVEGRLLQALALCGDENVLEIGTGSGFVTACIATLAHHVTSLDIHEDFLQDAGARLEAVEIENVTLRSMDATRELPLGNFDAIAVTGSLQVFDPRLANALTIGGRMFVVVGDSPVMDARIVRRSGDTEWDSESLFETELKPLVNAALAPQFLF